MHSATISILTLHAEGDYSRREKNIFISKFLSSPSVRRATAELSKKSDSVLSISDMSYQYRTSILDALTMKRGKCLCYQAMFWVRTDGGRCDRLRFAQVRFVGVVTRDSLEAAL